jgi:hypothetical protein
MLHSEYVEFFPNYPNTPSSEPESEPEPEPEPEQDQDIDPLSDNDSMPSLISITEPTTESISKYPTPPKSIYFGGTGCAGGFYVGVVKAMEDMWGSDFVQKYPDMKIYGDSIGSITAIILLLGYSAQEFQEIFHTIGKDMKNTNLLFYGFDYFLDKFFKQIIQQHPDILQKINGRFQCGYTTVNLLPIFEYKACKQFFTVKQLVDTVRSSYNIPIYCKRRYNNNKNNRREYGMDGAYSFDGSHFPHGDETLFVGLSQICADINDNIDNIMSLLPYPGQPYYDLIDHGYNAMISWDGSYCKKTDARTPNYPILYAMWVLNHVQSVWNYSTDWIYPYIKPMTRDVLYDSDDDSDNDELFQ